MPAGTRVALKVSQERGVLAQRPYGVPTGPGQVSLWPVDREAEHLVPTTLHEPRGSPGIHDLSHPILGRAGTLRPVRDDRFQPLYLANFPGPDLRDRRHKGYRPHPHAPAWPEGEVALR